MILLQRTRVDKYGHRFGLFECRCGNQTEVPLHAVKSGHTTSCGCYRLELLKNNPPRRIHGHNGKLGDTPTYRSWYAMKQRCKNKRHKYYPNYGGRGIKVCERWETFANFLADMGIRPVEKSIDRIDSNGNYEPGNCRWATRSEQNANQRRHA